MTKGKYEGSNYLPELNPSLNWEHKEESENEPHIYCIRASIIRVIVIFM